MVQDLSNDQRYGPKPDEFDDEFKEILNDIAKERGDINRRKLGRWIKRNEGRIVNGLRLNRASGGGSASAWRVEQVE